MNRKCGQNGDDRRTFTDKDKVHRIQTRGNDNNDVMLDCESGFHQSEDKRKLNCHKLRSSYVTISITKITFAMFLPKLSTLIRCYFSLCFISFVAFMRTSVYGGRELPLQIFKFLGISFVIFLNFDLFLIFLFKIKASESKMEIK